MTKNDFENDKVLMLSFLTEYKDPLTVDDVKKIAFETIMNNKIYTKPFEYNVGIGLDHLESWQREELNKLLHIIEIIEGVKIIGYPTGPYLKGCLNKYKIYL